MKLNSLCAAIALTMGVAGAVHADDTSGKVTFNGTIVEAACTIVPASADQTVDMGEVATVALQNSGKSSEKEFSIELENCDSSIKSSVTTTFTGTADATVSSLLALTGTATGAGIGLAEEDGTALALGSASNAFTLVDGNNSLKYKAYLQGNGDAITPGAFSAVANFTLAYQ